MNQLIPATPKITRPKILEDAGFDIYVDTSELRDLPIPIQQIDIKDLIWCFDFPFWEKDGTDDWNLTPRDVIEKKPETTEHMKKIEEASLDYPIVVILHKEKWVILDGIHRLVKAYLLEKPIIDAKVLTKDNEFFINALK